MKKCRNDFYTVLEDARFQCCVCPNRCTLSPGKRGRCGAFEATDDGVYSTIYGKTSGLCIDPIEKKPLNHFLPGSATLSIGTIGCNLSCSFCQNWDISLNRQRESMMRPASPGELVSLATENDCQSIACTYNEPTIFIDYCLDIADAAHAADIKMVAVTNGYIEGCAREQFYRAFDAVNVDLKAFTETFYKTHCGAHLQPVLETLEYIRNKTDAWLEITTLLIPGENDSETELDQLFSWIMNKLGNDTPLHLTAFQPQYKMKDRRSTPPRTVIAAREQALKKGLRYVYTGNIFNPEGEQTRCPACNTTVIGRNRYQLDIWNMKGNACSACNQEIPGLYNGPPGNWGNQRQRIP